MELAGAKSSTVDSVLLDGSKAAEQRLQSMLHWDVNNGVARRAWARTWCKGCHQPAMEAEEELTVTCPISWTKAFDQYRGGHHDAAFRRVRGRPHLNSAGGRHGGEEKATVAVSEDAWPQIHAARRVVERIVETGETVYGINTGFGALVHEPNLVRRSAQLQVNLIRSHATAIGELMSVEAVRAMMVIRLNSLCKGHSGIHPDCIHQLVLYLNNGLHPAVPRIGSLGASGDLAPSPTLH